MATLTWNEKFIHSFENKVTVSWASNPVTHNIFSNPWVLSQTKTGSPNADWREKLKRGEFCASPYSVVYRRITSTPVAGTIYCTEHRPSAGEKVFSSFKGTYPGPWVIPFPTVPVEVKNKALSRILEKIRHEYQHVGTLPALGEIGATIRMFGSPFSSLTKFTGEYLDELRLRRSKLKGRTLKKRRANWESVVSSTYLEYTFGLNPLIQDTRKIAEALARWRAEGTGELPHDTRYILHASASGDDQVVSSAGSYHGPGGSNAWIGKTHWTSSAKFGARYTVQLGHSVQANFGSLERLMQLLGFTPAEFVPTVWEVLPWSWLVDYFLNVQDIIEAGFTNTSNVKGIVLTERVKGQTIQSHIIDYDEARRLDGSFGRWLEYSAFPKTLGSTVYEYVTVNRTLPATLGLPELVLSFPNSVSKLANMAAVLLARKAGTRTWIPTK